MPIHQSRGSVGVLTQIQQVAFFENGYSLDQAFKTRIAELEQLLASQPAPTDRAETEVC